MMAFRPGDRISLRAGATGARLMALDGATINGTRNTWWNLVSSSKERIEEARQTWNAADWESGRFRPPPGDDGESIAISPEPNRTSPRG